MLHASGVAFAVLKWAGVAYLLWMAWSTLRDRDALEVRERPRVPVRRVLADGVTLNLLNPKLTIFFFAFLPQFAPAGDLATMLTLSGTFMALTLVVFVGYGLCAALVRDRVLARPRVMDGFRRVFAATFVLLSGRLALETR